MYRIIKNKKVKEVEKIELISTSLEYDCEIYDISDGETYLGMITPKVFHYISIEVAGYVFNNYYKNELYYKNVLYYKQRMPFSNKCIELGRKYINNESSVSKDQLEDAFGNLSMFSNDDVDACIISAIRCIYIYKSCNNKKVSLLDSLYCGLNSFRYAAMVMSAIQFASKETDKSVNVEYRRQGEFIVELLKSNKHLFMV